MCNGASTIAYGIVIKTWTLLIASKGFSKIKPILLALDLILLRKKTGELQVDGRIEGKKNFGDLPLEIIEIVKREVILNVDLLEQAETLLRDLCCEDGSVHCCDRCSGHHDEHELSQRDYRVVIQGDCDSCRENLFEFTLDLEVEMFVSPFLFNI